MRKKMENKAAWILIMIAVIFIAVGIFRGEMADVFLKSTNICLECIGIG